MRLRRILIVDDSAVMRRLLAEVLASDPLMQVVGTAENGMVGLAKVKELNPDLVILDIEMPVMDGLAALKVIRKLYPKLPVIIFSSLSGKGSTVTFEAIALGASDYVGKPGRSVEPSQVIEHMRTELLPKIKSLVPAPRPATPEAKLREVSPEVRRRVDVVAIGSSTGGPNALNDLLSRLPEDFPVPVLIVQHMPAVFTHMLAERLNMLSPLEVKEARTGDSIEPGHVYIAPGGYHMVVASKAGGTSIVLNQDPPENSCRPAVDVLFRSVADVYVGHALALVLTGMGADGTAGAKAVRTAGGELWVQDRDSSVVWGMPGSVVAAGFADRICPIEEIATDLMVRVATGRDSRRPNVNRKSLSAEAQS